MPVSKCDMSIISYANLPAACEPQCNFHGVWRCYIPDADFIQVVKCGGDSGGGGGGSGVKCHDRCHQQGLARLLQFRLTGFSPGARTSVQTYFCLPWNSILSSLYTVAVRVSKIVVWTNRKRITQIPPPSDKKQACSRSLASSGYIGWYQIDTNPFTFETKLLYFQWFNWQWENRTKHEQKAIGTKSCIQSHDLEGRADPKHLRNPAKPTCFETANCRHQIDTAITIQGKYTFKRVRATISPVQKER